MAPYIESTNRCLKLPLLYLRNECAKCKNIAKHHRNTLASRFKTQPYYEI